MRRSTLGLCLLFALSPCACADDVISIGTTGSASLDTGESSASMGSGSETAGDSASGDGDPATGDGDGDTDSASGDGDGDSGTGDGDGDSGSGDGDGDSGSGDGDGDSGTGDGDGDSGTGDGDGDTTGDGDGDTTGDGDGDMTGDGDGDMTGDGDGDMTGDGDGDDGFVDLGDFWIASTEVSVEEYEAFLTADPGFDALPAACAWKNDYTPGSWNSQLGNDPARPVVRVDWCDAYAYCEWAGYHLCGEVGGGAAALDDFDNIFTNEWYRACSNDGALLYPYGNGYDGAACNGSDAGIGSLIAGGSLLTCEGGVAGLYDMSGNAWEWTNACASNDNIPDQDENCRRRGGSYFSTSNVLRCAIDSTRERSFRNGNTGLRCCL